jgi:glycosyltransferase involved in cell wall biosynthesis
MVGNWPVPKITKLPGLHIGIFSTGLPWKNIDTQIIAAAATPGLAMLHVQNLRHPELPNQLGIAYKVHPYYTDRREFYKLAASMRINLAVTLTECFGYFALESFVIGVPALVGTTTPSFRHAQGILKKCIVSYIDDPAAISDAIVDVMDNYDEILDAGRAFIKKHYR